MRPFVSVRGVVKTRVHAAWNPGSGWGPPLALAAVLLTAALPARAQYAYEVLHAFEDPPRYPNAALVKGSDGALYGTTAYGGTSGCGTVFEIGEDGSGFTILHNFDKASGANPYAALVSSGGFLYGTTGNGGKAGYGTVFKIGEDGSGFTILHSFDNTDGANPYDALVSSGGVLYGTTLNGGTSGDGSIFYGTVFRIGEDGSGFAILHNFTRTDGDGGNPFGRLVSSGGFLYGTTGYGGTSGAGTIFKIGEGGSGFYILHNFDRTDGTYPNGALVSSGGVLYGTTASGGKFNYGNVFKIGEDGSAFTILHSFDGTFPLAGVVGSGGVFYGTAMSGDTAAGGIAFKIGEDGSGFTILHTFNRTDGRNPWAVLLGSDGFLYGTTQGGGMSGPITDSYGGYGTVFKMNTDGSGFAIVHNFNYTSGAYPRAALVSSGGSLYGTTPEVASSYGTVFKLGGDGSGFTILHNFDNANGANPQAELVSSGGFLYGTTANGGTFGYGTVFKMGEDGSGFTVLHNFDNTDGAHPYAALVSKGGFLYGTTAYGGTSDYGTVFKIGEDGSGFAMFHNFNNTDGANPFGALVSSGGVLYGTTGGGGTGYGTVFKIGEDGSGFTILYNFGPGSTDGAGPRAGVVSSRGILYGTTVGGGTGYGTVFRIGEDGSGFSVLHHFDLYYSPADGAFPQAALIASQGVLYGTVLAPESGEYGYGNVFKIGEDGSQFEILHSFDRSDGAFPYGGLVSLGDALHGTASQGGPAAGGALFRLVPPAVSPSSLTFGSQPVFTPSAPQTIGVRNFSSTPLLIGTVAFEGLNRGDFTLSSNTCVSPMAIWESCTLGITFTPTALGSRTATVSIADDGAASPHLVGLSGTGTDTIPPTVSLITPNGGELLFKGTPHVIHWTASDNGGVISVDVAFSADGGTRFRPVPGCSGLAGTAQSCAWASPGPATMQGRIRVTARDGAGLGGAATSSGNFAVRAGPPNLTLTVPNTAATWRIANTQKITFNHNLGVGQSVVIDLSRDGGATWATINPAFVTTSATTGSFSWVVTGPPTAMARARVRWSANPIVTGLSKVNFRIVDRISMTVPNTPVTWAIGSRHNISWSHNLGASESVNIDVSRDGGSTWSSVATNVANRTATTGSYSWLVNAPASTATRIRVSWSAQPSVSSVSAEDFKVSGKITVTPPTGATSWAIGSNRAITWQHNLGPGQSFDIDLSTDGGMTFPTPIASAVMGDGASGSYNWVVAGPPSAKARIRVSGPANSAASGTTGNFRMAAPVITVTSPNTAVKWTIGTTRAITWSHNLGTQESVDIYESSDGGVNWTLIATTVPNTTATTGAFNWLVAAPASATARIRVTWAADTTVKGQSAVNFTVANPVAP